VHPSLIAGEEHSEYALKGRNLVFEAILITIKDSDTSLAGKLVGWVCINNMSIWCLVGSSFGPLYLVAYTLISKSEKIRDFHSYTHLFLLLVF
jgi:hypothetical protein